MKTAGEVLGQYLKGTQTQASIPTPQIDPWEDSSYRPNPNCKVCGGFGFVHPVSSSGVVHYNKVVPCKAPQCLVDSVRAFLTGDVNLSSRGIYHMEQTFSSFQILKGQNDACYKFAYDFCHGSEWFWLLIYGGNGNGKSHLLNAIGNYLVEANQEVLLIEAPQLFAEARRAIGQGNADEVIARYESVPWLLVDDWGAGHETDWAAGRFEELMLSRFNRGLRTAVTTNRDFSQLSPRVTSRFSDERYSRVALNTGPDKRKERKGVRKR